MSRPLAVSLVFLLGLFARDAEAGCLEGSLGSCTFPNGCKGVSECINGRMFGCECDGAASNSCTVCGRSGSLSCDSSCNPIGQCSAKLDYELCNNCDDNKDGLVDNEAGAVSANTLRRPCTSNANPPLCPVGGAETCVSGAWSACTPLPDSTWSGDFRDPGGDLKQYGRVHCGAPGGVCPGTSGQGDNFSTDNSLDPLEVNNCLAPSTDALGCRYNLAHGPTIPNFPPRTPEFADCEHILQVRVKAGDALQGAGGNRNELAKSKEQCAPKDYVNGEERYYGFSIFLPDGSSEVAGSFPDPVAYSLIKNPFNVFFQFHDLGNCGAFGVPLTFGVNRTGFSLDGSQYQFTLFWKGVYDDETFSVPIWTENSAVSKGQWHSIVLRVKWNNDPSLGLVELWKNGIKVHTSTRNTLMTWRSPHLCLADQQAGFPTSGAMPVYLKMGIYREAAISDDATAYFRHVKAGTTCASVWPHKCP